MTERLNGWVEQTLLEKMLQSSAESTILMSTLDHIVKYWGIFSHVTIHAFVAYFGCYLIYISRFLYEDEEKKLRSRVSDTLDEMWTEVDDLSKSSKRFHTKLLNDFAKPNTNDRRELMRERYGSAWVFADDVFRILVRQTLFAFIIYLFIRHSQMWIDARIKFYQLILIASITSQIVWPLNAMLLFLKKRLHPLYLAAVGLPMMAIFYGLISLLLIIAPLTGRYWALSRIAAMTMLPYILATLWTSFWLSLLLMNHLLWPIVGRVLYAIRPVADKPVLLASLGAALVVWAFSPVAHFSTFVEKFPK